MYDGVARRRKIGKAKMVVVGGARARGESSGHHAKLYTTLSTQWPINTRMNNNSFNDFVFFGVARALALGRFVCSMLMCFVVLRFVYARDRKN